MLFRDQVNAERRNTRIPLLSSQVEDQIDEIFGENSNDGMEAMEEERQMPIPKNLYFQMIQNLQKEFKQKLELLV